MPRPSIFAAVQILSISIASIACANPSGGKVIAGAASFEGGAGALTIRQSGERGIIDWEKFSIAGGEVTKFLQPGATSALLNRVTGGASSQLLGTLQANGRIFLLNPNGILIGGGAKIDTNGFVASTLDVANDEFMAGGDLKFFGSSTAKVSNLGTINAGAGDIFLIAREVENQGTLNAPNGVVGLGAGQEVLLKSAGDERLFVSPSGAGSVVNAGTIAAVQAELKANGGNMYALAVNNTGTIRATGIQQRNGRVILSAGGGTVKNSGTIAARSATGGGVVKMAAGRGKAVNAGTIDAAGRGKGQKGGRVEITGDAAELAAGSLVDVSGDTGGGTALIGGDFQGKNPVIPNSKSTKIAAGATIRADALTSGDGGRVIVWSDEQTLFTGAISARGGAAGGDGGFAEVSGKLTLDYRGLTDLSAPAGTFGTLLLDPKNITVATGGTAARGDVDEFSDNAGGDSVIAPATLDLARSSIVLQATNDITFASPLTLTTIGASLTAQAGRSIFVNASIETFAGGITFVANDPAAVSGRDPGAPAITMLAGTQINSRNGAVRLTIASGPTAGDITLVKVLSGTGTITVASTGAILDDLSNAASLTGAKLALRATTIGAGTANRLNISASFLEAQSADALFIEQTSGPLTIGGVDAGLSGVQVTAPDASPAQLELRNRAGGIFITTPGEGVTASGNVTIRALGFTSDLVFANDGVAVRSTAGAVSLLASRDIFLGDVTLARFGDVRGATGVSLQADSDISILSSVVSTDTAAATLSLNAGFGSSGSTIQILRASSNRTPGVVGSGGGRVLLNAGSGGTFVNNPGGAGGILAGPVRIQAEHVELSSGNVSAGTGLVEIYRPSILPGLIEIGSENPDAISLTDAELDTITAGELRIGVNPASITINGPISRPISGPTYGVLSLFSGGAIFVNANVDVGSGSLVLSGGSNILGGGNITALSVNAGTAGGSITLDGAVRVGALTLNAPNGNIFVDGNANNIGTLSAATFSHQFHLKDSAGGLRTEGFIDGGNDSSGSIEVRGGSLVLGAGTQIFVNGFAQNFQLFSDTAFINQAGANAIATESGGRWVIYAPGNSAAQLQLGGLVPQETVSNVTYPTVPTNTGNTLVLGGVVPPSGVQQIFIVAGSNAADDGLLDDGQILFGDTGVSGSTLTISKVKLESFSGGSITLQAATRIELTLGVDLALTLSGAGSLVTLQTSLAGAQITLGGNLTTGGASISLAAPAGFIATRVLNAAGGNVTASGSTVQFASITTPTGTVKLTTTAGEILDSPDGATSITASRLALFSSFGIGFASNPLNTAVDHLEAGAVARVFVTNTGKDLAIGGIDSELRGVNVSLNFGDDIQIVNDRSIFLTAADESVQGPKAITLQANGGSSDLRIGNRSDLAVGGDGATVTLNAGRDLVLGVDGAYGDVLGKTVDLNAGHAAIIDEGSFVTGKDGINVTAGTVIAPPDGRQNAILIRRLISSGARLGTNGGAINLTTAAGGVIDVNSGSLAGSLRTTLRPGVSGFVNLRADDIRLFDRIDAGTALVRFLPAGSTRAIDVGTNTAGQLGLTDNELNLVTASAIVIGDDARRTPVRVTAPITASSYGALGLYGSVVDLAALNSAVGAAITVPVLQIEATFGITGDSAITAATSLDLTSDTANIFLDGPVTTGVLTADAKSFIHLISLVNRISALGDILRGGDLLIRNGLPLQINGVIAGSDTATNVTIRTTGGITLGTGAQIVATGSANMITLEAFDGHFINNAGSSALSAQSGARYRVYSKDQGVPFTRGGLSGNLYTSGNATFGSDPLAPANVFYFQDAAAQPLPPSSSSTGTTGGPAFTAPQAGQVASADPFAAALLAALLRDPQAAAAFAEANRKAGLEGAAQSAWKSQDAEEAARQARLANWPPEGTTQLGRKETREDLEQGWAAGNPDWAVYSKDLYTKLLNLPPAKQVEEINRLTEFAAPVTQNPPFPDVDSRTARIVMAQNSLVFTSEEALLQYLRDRGTDWFDQQKRIVTSDADWVYLGPTSTLNAQYFYLYVGDGSPLGQPLPKQPIPAPIVVAPIASSNSVQIAQQAANDAKLAQQAAANEAQVASAQKVVSQQEAQTATAQTRFDELNGAVNRQRGLANATALERLNAELKLGIPSNDPLGFAMSHHDALRAKAVAKNQGAEFDQSYALLKNYDDIIKSFLADLRGAETELAGHRKVLVKAQTDLAAIRTTIAKTAPASGGSGGIPVSVSDLVK